MSTGSHDTRHRLFDFPREVQIGGHRKPGSAVKDNFFDAVCGSLKDSSGTGAQGRAGGKGAEARADLIANLLDVRLRVGLVL